MDSGWTGYIALNGYWNGSSFQAVNGPAYGGFQAARMSFGSASSAFMTFDTASGPSTTTTFSYTERMRIANSGNVGIGITAPQSNLHVNAAVGGNGLTIGPTAPYVTSGFMFALSILNDGLTIGQGTVIQIGKSAFNSMFISYIVTSTPDTDYVSFAGYGKAAGLYLRNDGKVGVGTASPGYQFEATDIIRAQNYFMGVSEGSSVGINTAWPLIRSIQGVGVWLFKQGSNNEIDLSLRSVTSGTSTERVRILANGNVGIGITNPTKPLVVNRIAGGGDNNPAIMIGNNGVSSGLRFQTYDLVANSIAYMGLGTDMGGNSYEHSLVFSYGGGVGRQTIGSYDGTTYSTKMTILGNGHVGIGVSPAYPLHVGIGGPISGSVKYWNFNTPTISSYSGPFTCSIYGISDIVTSGSFTAFSDKRAKLLEAPLEETFSNLVQKIEVHQYSWINKAEKGGTKRVGFFAQEVEKVIPDAVGKNTNVVPTIYREADSFTDTTITIKGHGLTTEKKIEVVDPENDKHVAEITRVIDSDTIEVKFEKKPKDKLFVIGPEVDDSRVINHDYLMAVSFGAVKEIIEENKSLRNQISSLAARLEALEQIQLK
jgi:hypothetical protein